MRGAISNTSPLQYLYRIDRLSWLPQLFEEVWVPSAVARELEVGRQRGYDVPNLQDYPWLQVIESEATLPSALAVNLGPGESAALALTMEHPDRIVLLDDGVARQIARNAGLGVWGTLRVLLEAKSQGLTDRIAPLIAELSSSGMWLSDEVRSRILVLANESET